MTDPIAPTDPLLIGTDTMGQRTRFGGGTDHSKAPTQATGVPEIDQWLANWQQKNLGQVLDSADRGLLNLMGRTMNGRNLLPVSVPHPFPVNLEERPRESSIDLDPMLALRHGFEGSTIGTLQRYFAMDSSPVRKGDPTRFDVDPTYDPFADPAIRESPFKDRMDLFGASRSAAHSAWIMQYLTRHERDSSRLEAMSGGGQIFDMAGGMLGDPLNFLPASLGIKGVTLARRTAMMSAPENALLGFKPVVWGGIKDGLRASAAQAAIALVDAGVQESLDPSAHAGSVGDVLALPGAIAAGVGFLTGAYGRYQAGANALERAAGNESFLAGTRPRSRPVASGEGPSAPGVLSPAERRYWENATAANPQGRFAIDGQVMGWDGPNVVFRTSEGLDVHIPHKDIDMASESASRGITVSSQALQREPALMASAYHLDGEFLGGGVPKIWRQDHAAVAPGAMAGDYTRMRATELTQSGMLGALRAVEHPAFTRFMQGNKLADAQGQPVPFYHGTRNSFSEFDPRKTGSRFGTGASDNPLFWFTNHPGEASAYAEGKALRGTDLEGAPQVRKAFLRAENPADITDLFTQEIEAHPDWPKVAPHMAAIVKGEASAAEARKILDGIRHDVLAEIIPYLKEQGHDAAMLTGTGVGAGENVQQAVVFDRAQIKHLDERYQLVGGAPGSLDDVEISKGSMGAANVGSAHSRRAQLIGNRMVATGIGLEKLPFDVINRAAMLPFTTWQTTVEDMLSSGGRLRVKNTAAGGFERSGDPVEILIRTNWLKPTYDAIREIRDMWEMHRTGSTPVDPSDLHRIGFELKTAITDKIGRTQGMRFEEFRRRVGDSMINGDKDLIVDQATPHVEQAAAKVRGLWEDIKQGGMESGLFREAHEEQVAKAEAKLAGLKKNGSPEEVANAERHLARVKQLLSDVISEGPTVDTAKSYRPRIWLQDQLRDRAAEFKQIVDDWLRQTQPALSADRRRDIATDIHETLIRDKPVWEKKPVDQLFSDLADPGMAKARTFMIPDMLVKDFLENDVEALVRSHSRIMGTAIEMHKRFGSTGMEDQIGEIHMEAQALYNAAPTNEAKRQIVKQRDLAKADLEASRDRLYGVYGAPDDPHRWTSRAVRMAKQFTNLTTLGMSGVTAMADLVRPLMTEGLQAVHDYGFRTLASDARSTIFRMSRRELELAGDAMELIANTRALSLSDAGDMFRSRTPFERGLAKTNSWFFVVNGLNAINQLDKEWAGVIIQGNINRAIIRQSLGRGTEPWMLARLAGAGIDDPMIQRIAAELSLGGKGSNRFGSLVLADTEKWQDVEAARAYRVALNQMVNRTVPTPTLGDTPNWFSTELGTLMTQYKSFAFGALNRSLVSGLQEEGRQFWYGAAAAVGFAMLLNEVRSRLMYDRSTFDKPMPGVLLDAVDRSSILGYFSDANKSIEVLTNHRAGLRPFTGGERARPESGARVAGAVAGPAAGQAVNALTVLGDFMSMHPTARTMADARQLWPGQNLPYLDPAFDRLISDGNRFPARSVNRRPGSRTENVPQ